jgi:Tripartite tricarboxylate transporter family receptor
MKLPRRKFLHLAAGAAALPAVSRIARAQAYPTRPVRIIVGFPPGGPSDLLARLIGQWLSDHLGQPFIVENRPKASGNIATEAVIRAPTDGHTLLLVVPGNAISDVLYDKLNFSFIRDTAPVAGIDANLAIRLGNIGSIAHQTAGLDELTELEHRGHRIARRQCKARRFEIALECFAHLIPPLIGFFLGGNGRGTSSTRRPPKAMQRGSPLSIQPRLQL